MFDCLQATATVPATVWEYIRSLPTFRAYSWEAAFHTYLLFSPARRFAAEQIQCGPEAETSGVYNAWVPGSCTPRLDF